MLASTIFPSSCVTVSKIMLILTLTTSQHQILNRFISRYQIQDVHYYIRKRCNAFSAFAQERVLPFGYKMLQSQFTEMSIPCIIYVCFGILSLWLEILL